MRRSGGLSHRLLDHLRPDGWWRPRSHERIPVRGGAAHRRSHQAALRSHPRPLSRPRQRSPSQSVSPARRPAGAGPRHGRMVRHRRLRARPDTGAIHIRPGEIRCGDGRQGGARQGGAAGFWFRRVHPPRRESVRGSKRAGAVGRLCHGQVRRRTCRRVSTERR